MSRKLEERLKLLEEKYEKMFNEAEELKNSPNGLGMIFLNNCFGGGKDINMYLNLIRDTNHNYITHAELPRFSDGSGKTIIKDSVRKKDLFIICDPIDYSKKMKFHGEDIPLSMDNHAMDIIRTVTANKSHASRLTLVNPFLLYGRQHRRKGREGLDCAAFLRIIKDIGISNILSFDLHDPGLLNAIPFTSFENAYPTDYIIDDFLINEVVDLKNTVVIAPDGGALGRAEHFADRFLYAETGSFHKKRNLLEIVEGQAPIEEHIYKGESVKDKTVILVDDMISSGSSIINSMKKLKEAGAHNIYVFVSFSLFTSGVRAFQKCYEEGTLDKVYTTNLNYMSEEIKTMPWLHIVDCYEQMAKLINAYNRQNSLTPFLGGIPESVKTVERVKTYIKEYSDRKMF